MCVALAGTGCLAGLREGRTPTEKSLLGVAEEIRIEGQGNASDRSAEDLRASDDSVARLREKARKLWAASPSNSARVTSGAGASGYEVEIVDYALVDYFVATGRTGLAIPVLEEAVAESKRLRYYEHWQGLTLDLVELYQRLGMIDQARERIAGQLAFLGRIGYSLDRFPPGSTRDAVVFVTLHARQVAIRPGDYADAKQLVRLYDFYLASLEASPESWGWAPGSGYRFVEIAAPFAIRLAELGDVQAAKKVRDDLSRLHRINRTRDPIVFANERRIDWNSSQYGRDLHRALHVMFHPAVGSLRGTIQDQPPDLRRYLARDAIVEATERARIDLALGEYSSALAAAEQASKSFAGLRTFYQSMSPALVAQDGLLYDERALDRLRAEILEALGRFAEAEGLYEGYIAWSEQERSSVPLEQRMHFFRGQAREAYLGSIRSAVRLYLRAEDGRRDPGAAERAFDRILVKAERLRARQFQELLGTDAGSAGSLSRAALVARLGSGEAVLQLLDLDSHLAAIVVSKRVARVQLIEKSGDWDAEIFRIRNQLADSRTYDRAAFERLGRSLLGFAARDLDTFDRLHVVVDGAMSALPPSILSYAPGRMLSDRAVVTLVPSLSLLLAAGDAPAPSQTAAPRAFVLGDPVFDAEAVIDAQIGRGLMATRGSASLGYFQQLPETADEARAVVSALSSGSSSGASSRLLLGPEATESGLKNDPDLASYSHFHFATHGVISNDLPNLSEPALVLGWEEGEDGFLTANEVAKLGLHARLTVLSACNTGNGEYFDGEGLMGMGRAFLLAGSDRVVVSLWPVESFSTQRLMELFYARMSQGEPEDRALWQAQRDLRSEGASQDGAARGIATKTPRPGVVSAGTGPYANPFYWSPFVLISAK